MGVYEEQTFSNFRRIIQKIDELYDTHAQEIYDYIRNGTPMSGEAKHMLLISVTSDDDWTAPFYRNLINSGIPEFRTEEFIYAAHVLTEIHRKLVDFVRSIPTR